MFAEKHPCVYILSHFTRSTISIGATSDLYIRLLYHRNSSRTSFSWRYDLQSLIYLEEYVYTTDAIAREKQLKNWHREWKFNLIRSQNPMLRDLYPLLFPSLQPRGPVM